MFTFRESLWKEYCAMNQAVARAIEAEVERMVAEAPSRPIQVWIVRSFGCESPGQRESY